MDENDLDALTGYLIGSESNLVAETLIDAISVQHGTVITDPGDPCYNAYLLGQ